MAINDVFTEAFQREDKWVKTMVGNKACGTLFLAALKPVWTQFDSFWFKANIFHYFYNQHTFSTYIQPK